MDDSLSAQTHTITNSPAHTNIHSAIHRLSEQLRRPCRGDLDREGIDVNERVSLTYSHGTFVHPSHQPDSCGWAGLGGCLAGGMTASKRIGHDSGGGTKTKMWRGLFSWKRI